MAEAFLYYLWQYQYFNKTNLQTAAGEPLVVFSPGVRNTDAGPDFENARIRLMDLEWVGTVEIHVHSSDWFIHHHHDDRGYENVVLHVVWQNDKTIYRKDGSIVPTLELKDLVDPNLLVRYKQLTHSIEDVPCNASWGNVKDVTRLSMVDHAAVSRLEQKALDVLKMLKNNNHDWEETCYQLLARNFGFKVNAEPFLQLARQLPYKYLLKHADKLHQVEALLLGQAGFLEENRADLYCQVLQREYSILAQKYSLTDTRLHKAQWKFLRLRPANFPTLRLAQLAALIHSVANIFSGIIDAPSYPALRQLFSVNVSAYWKAHYHFGKETVQHDHSLGEASIDNIIINTVCPLLAAYGRSRDEQALLDRAADILQKIPAESNRIVKRWNELGVKPKAAFDSQGLIELYNRYCLKRRCLDCSIGNALLKPQRV